MDSLTLASLLLYFAEVLGFFIVATLVILRKKAPLYVAFATFAYLAGIWQLLQFLAKIVSANHDIAILALRASVAVAGPMSASFLIFGLIRSGKNPRRLLFFGLGLMAGILSLFSRSLHDVEIDYLAIGVPKLDVWYGILLLYGAFCVFYGAFSIWQHFKHETNKIEHRIDRVLLVSMLSVGSLVVLFSFYTSEFSQTIIAQHIIPTATLILVLSFSYAIYRGLFDIHFFVVRALAYLVTILVITVGFVAPVVFIFARFLDYKYSFGEFALLVVASVIALYFLQYIRKLFDRLTAKLFFRRFYDPQDVLDRLTNALVSTIDASVVITNSTEIISRALHPNFMSFFLHQGEDKDTKEFLAAVSKLSFADSNVVVVDELSNGRYFDLLNRQKIAVVVKLHTTSEELGYIALGHKQSGQEYTKRDVRLLNTAAHELALAIQNALRFEEIQNFNITLQKEVKRATKQLEEKNKRLILLDQTKDDFISMASHQLRTPLTSVKGYLSMTLEGDGGAVSKKQRKLLSQAFISSQRMVYLIADMLNVSRLKTGKFVITPEPTNLAEAVQTEIDQLKGTAAARGLTLTYKKPKDFPVLMLDQTKIRQVIMNFADNAIYYTPSGGHIDVELKDTDKTIELTVTDDGIGVPKKEQHRLFSKFYRAGNAKKARPDGTGLGLYMAKKVIIGHGGSIIFKSKEGKGSTFGFSINKSKLEPITKAKPAKTKTDVLEEKQKLEL